MEKFCWNCGEKVDDESGVCPNCGLNFKDTMNELAETMDDSSDAAFFTHMADDVHAREKKELEKRQDKELRREKLRSGKIGKPIIISAFALLAIAVAIFAFLYSRPVARTCRALESDDIELASKIYVKKLSGQGIQNERLIGLVEDEAYEAVYSYSILNATEAEVESVFSELSVFDCAKAELSNAAAEYESLRTIHRYITDGDALLENGQYMDAYESYLRVPEGDVLYTASREYADNALNAYSENAVSRANELISEENYSEAISFLRQADNELAGYGTFSQNIDDKLDDCCSLFEIWSLEQAAGFAGKEEYEEAIEILNNCTEVLQKQSERISTAVEQYQTGLENKTVRHDADVAIDIYENGNVEAAFEKAEEILAQYPNNEFAAQALITLKERFGSDQIQKAVEALDGKQANLDSAIAVVESALEIYSTARLEAALEYLQSRKPVSLITLTYKQKDGVIYRSSSKFESTSGTNYDKWIWGGNGNSILFEISGDSYDKLAGTFAVRNTEDAEISGHFEVYEGNNVIYESDALGADGTPYDFSIPISDSNLIKIVFYCDYETSTVEDGYCYHGICNPVIYRELDDPLLENCLKLSETADIEQSE